MEKIERLNCRVYAIVMNKGKILVLKEGYAGEILFKFPGGGLELGEGLKDTLIREFKEELNLKVENISHLYTQDFFLQSRFRKNEQLLTIYYEVTCSNLHEIKALDKGIQEILWIPLQEISDDLLPLPVDKIVLKLLREKYLN